MTVRADVAVQVGAVPVVLKYITPVSLIKKLRDPVAKRVLAEVCNTGCAFASNAGAPAPAILAAENRKPAFGVPGPAIVAAPTASSTRLLLRRAARSPYAPAPVVT